MTVSPIYFYDIFFASTEIETAIQVHAWLLNAPVKEELHEIWVASLSFLF